jgi:hypothetical protein
MLVSSPLLPTEPLSPDIGQPWRPPPRAVDAPLAGGSPSHNSGDPPLLGGLGDLSGPSPANPAAGPAGILAGAAPGGREGYIVRRKLFLRATAQK